MRVLPFFEPKPPATQSSSPSRSTRAWCDAKCQVSRERFCSETYSSLAAWSTNSSVTAFEYAAVSSLGDAYSSISEARAPSSATTTSRQNVCPVTAMRTYSGFSSCTPLGTTTRSPFCHIAALCAANFSSQPTREYNRSFSSVSGSNLTPAGAFEMSIPSAVTVAYPATSRSSSAVTLSLPGTVPCDENSTGSKSDRFVKRQCSSVVSGIGSRSYAASASVLLIRPVPVVEEDAVARGIVDAGAVTDARVPHVSDGDASRLELRLRCGDVRDAERDRRRGQRCELVVVRRRCHHGERHVRGLELDPVVVLQPGVPRQAEHLAVEVRRRVDVVDGNADVVDARDLNHAVRTSPRGARAREG